jgi:putative ABC transport system permease protein
MLKVALQMLLGDRAKYIGLILGLSFASLIITQQAAIFLGLMTRTYNFITDTSQPDIWVMNSMVQFVDDVKPMKDTDLFRVRSIEGVKWAVPLYKGMIKARLKNGNYQTCNVIGLDDNTLIGGPPQMTQGKLIDLKRTDAIIVNNVGAADKLASSVNDGRSAKVPLQLGDILELNDHRAQVVGFCNTTRTFQSQPVIYTTYTRAIGYAPQERKLLSFVLVKAKDEKEIPILCKKIEALTGLSAYTGDQFKQLTWNYFLKKTGIPVNFGFAVLLGFLIGTAIAGQTFYNFILDNLRYLAVFKAMGTTGKVLLKMVIVQVAWVGMIGWGIGVGAAALFGFVSRHTELSFLLTPKLFLFSGLAILFICIISAAISLLRVFKLEPAIVFRS